jgi:hypothetical protein
MSIIHFSSSVFKSIALTCLLVSCGAKQEKPVVEKVAETTETPSGIIHLRELHVADSIEVEGKTYTYRYDFISNDSMPVVRNTQGDEYRDGQVTLLVRQGERTVFSRTFKKSDFNQLVPAKFMDTSALVGFTYNYTKLDDHSALYFIATVGDPDETADIAYPIQVRITPAGAMTMEKATGLDTEPIHPGMTIDPTEEDAI